MEAIITNSTLNMYHAQQRPTGWTDGCIAEIRELETVGKQLSRYRHKHLVYRHLTVWKD